MSRQVCSRFNILLLSLNLNCSKIAGDISKIAVFQYKCDEFYHPEADGGISITDKDLEIDWVIDPDDAILSDKDKVRVCLKDFNSPFIYEK